jgi:hypothetical protein
MRALGYTLILTIASGFVIWSAYQDQIPRPLYDLNQLPVLVHLSFYVAPGSALILWAWMFLDALSFKVLKGRGWWLLSLVFFNWLASIVYFLVVYRKKPLRSRYGLDEGGI